MTIISTKFHDLTNTKMKNLRENYYVNFDLELNSIMDDAKSFKYFPRIIPNSIAFKMIIFFINSVIVTLGFLYLIIFKFKIGGLISEFVQSLIYPEIISGGTTKDTLPYISPVIDNWIKVMFVISIIILVGVYVFALDDFDTKSSQIITLKPNSNKISKNPFKNQIIVGLYTRYYCKKNSELETFYNHFTRFDPKEYKFDNYILNKSFLEIKEHLDFTFKIAFDPKTSDKLAKRAKVELENVVLNQIEIYETTLNDEQNSNFDAKELKDQLLTSKFESEIVQYYQKPNSESNEIKL